MSEVVSTRVSEEMVKDLEEIESEEKTDRAAVVRKLLTRAIAMWKLEKALGLYRDGKITLWKAARLADLSLWEMMDIAKERKIPLQYTYEDFKEDFEAALKEK